MKNNSIDFQPDHERALAYFQAQPEYAPSPLRTFALADGDQILIKDETDRMKLGAFKALGGPYAVARLIERHWFAQYGEQLTPARLMDADVKSFAASLTFVCASAGNHGLGVAEGARKLGAKARVYLASSVPNSFDVRLISHGAQVVRAGETYEDSVAEAIEDAEHTGATLLADGTWPGYTEIPRLVMEGYTVIAEELRAEFEASDRWPTHVFLQAGVGGLAAAMAFMIRHNWAEQPELIIVEPDAAPCLMASHRAGKPTRADGPESIMGRLDCKEPSMVAWHALERCEVDYLTITDDESNRAAETISELGIPTTPSGAAGYAGLCKHQTNSETQAYLPLIVVSECVA